MSSHCHCRGASAGGQARWEGTYELEPGTTYFRAEVESRLPERARLDNIAAGLAMTNPIWVEHPAG